MAAHNEDGCIFVQSFHDRSTKRCALAGCRLCMTIEVWKDYKGFKYSHDDEGRLAGQLYRGNGTWTRQTILPTVCFEYSPAGTRIKPHRYHVSCVTDGGVWLQYDVLDHATNKTTRYTPEQFAKWWHSPDVYEVEIYCG